MLETHTCIIDNKFGIIIYQIYLKNEYDICEKLIVALFDELLE
jgi:hypothetical protein